MTENEKIRHILKNLPTEPGVYLMLDGDENIIYIGKAGSLKKRVSSYFQKKDHDAKTRVLVRNIRNIEFIVTDNEIEALLLENNLIKKHKPKFNVRLKDDKRYPYIAVTLNENFPRIIYTRNIKKNRDKYFGPYTDAKAAKNTVTMINNTFKLKTCRKDLPLKKGERPCLNYQINKCSGACENRISREEYMELVNNAVSFLEGNISPVLKSLSERMKAYSSKMDFEKAAQMRDIIYDIQKISETQKVDVASGLDKDYMGVSIFGNEAVLVLFEFRNGVLLGRKVNIFDNAAYSNEGELISSFIPEHYREKEEIPSGIVTSVQVEESKLLESYLSGIGSKKVKISHAKSADDRSVIKMLQRNIDIIAAERNEPEEYSVEYGLKILKERLGLEKEPERIDCFDISNFHGKDAVASMSVFINGRPEKSEYRRYRIRSYDEPNDPGMMHEAVSRRVQNIHNEELTPPDLILIDGGPTQLTRAIEAVENFSIQTKVISIAKKFEEIYTSPKEPPLHFEESSPALKILQNLRDEAHRFGITYHRKLRDRRTTGSVLDDIKSIGQNTKRLLLSHFGSIERISSASIDELSAVEGIGRKTAEKIAKFFSEE